jgi:hypothetical protein
MRHLLFVLLLVSGAANAAHHGSHAGTGGYAAAPHRSHVSTGAYGEETHARGEARAPRESSGRAHRSQAAKNAFKREHPCPGNGHKSGACPGYVIDHVKPLACGGADDPSNMQWQTVAAGKAKDRVERIGCK